jgi:uncharacterized protein (TIGR02996 family)
MHTKADFLRAICEVPEDDTLRLVFADWLEENDEPELAEFIRLQLCTNDITDRILRLLQTNSSKWIPNWHERGRNGPCWHAWETIPMVTTAPYKLAKECEVWYLQRGFACSFKSPVATFMQECEQVFLSHPIEKVWLDDRQAWEVEHFWNGSPQTPHVWRKAPSAYLTRPEQLPAPLFCLLKNQENAKDGYSSAYYETEQEADADLSQACVTYGRIRAGLPISRSIAVG